MLGDREGWTTMQEQEVADLLTCEGFHVRTTSAQPARLHRLLDTILCLLRWRSDMDLAIVSVYSGGAFAMAEAASLLLERMGVPIILVLHGGNLPDFAERHPRRVRRVLRRGRVVTPSPYLARTANELVTRVDVIPNGIDVNTYQFRERARPTPTLLWMRTFEPLYNPAMAVHALAQLQLVHPEATLTMAGQDRGLQSELERLVDTLDLAGQVDFVGYLGESEKRVALSNADFFVNTNRIDNTPVSVIEACAAGLVVVSTDVGGIPDLLTDGENASLVPDDDAEAMAESISAAMADPDRARSLSNGARRLGEACDWKRVRTGWCELAVEAAARSDRIEPSPP